MSFAAAALPALIGGAASVVGSIVAKPKAPKVTPAPAQLPQAQTRQSSAVLDAVAGRRGSLANQRTGARGAESTSTGQKTRLGA